MKNINVFKYPLKTNLIKTGSAYYNEWTKNKENIKIQTCSYSKNN